MQLQSHRDAPVLCYSFHGSNHATAHMTLLAFAMHVADMCCRAASAQLQRKRYYHLAKWRQLTCAGAVYFRTQIPLAVTRQDLMWKRGCWLELPYEILEPAYQPFGFSWTIEEQFFHPFLVQCRLQKQAIRSLWAQRYRPTSLTANQAQKLISACDVVRIFCLDFPSARQNTPNRNEEAFVPRTKPAAPLTVLLVSWVWPNKPMIQVSAQWTQIRQMLIGRRRIAAHGLSRLKTDNRNTGSMEALGESAEYRTPPPQSTTLSHEQGNWTNAQLHKGKLIVIHTLCSLDRFCGL